MGKPIQNLLNKKFGKLTVIAPILIDEKYQAWLCRCECGNERTYKAYQLNNYAISCGCINDSKKMNLVDQKFARLTVLEKTSSISGKHGTRWLCKCECGKQKVVLGEYLKNGDTKSCGCLVIEKSTENILAGVKVHTKRNPQKASAIEVWRDYYNDGDISFEKFLELSKLNCFYCGRKPFTIKDISGQNSSEYFKTNAEFIYNGLDRINSNLSHNLNNVVPCCIDCNYAKSNDSQGSYIKWLKDVYFNLKENGLI